MKSRLLNGGAVLITLAYPLALGYAHGRVEPRLLALLLFGTAAMRIALAKGGGSERWLWGLGAVVLAALTLSSNSMVPLKLYPVLINGVLLGVFGTSLLRPPSIIEKIARWREPNLPPHAVSYTKRVTQVWCGFFAINGSVALATTLWASPRMWSLYNGIIAYILMGLLFGGEYFVRQRFRRRHAA